MGQAPGHEADECLWYTYRKSGARGMSDRELKSAPKVKALLDEICIFIRNSKSVGERNTPCASRTGYRCLTAPHSTACP